MGTRLRVKRSRFQATTRSHRRCRSRLEAPAAPAQGLDFGLSIEEHMAGEEAALRPNDLRTSDVLEIRQLRERVYSPPGVGTNTTRSPDRGPGTRGLDEQPHRAARHQHLDRQGRATRQAGAARR